MRSPCYRRGAKWAPTTLMRASWIVTPTEDLASDLWVSWWALEDLNLRPLPCQGRPSQRSDQQLCSPGGFRAVSGVRLVPLGSVGSLTRC